MIVYETEKINFYIAFLECLFSSVFAYILCIGLPIYWIITIGIDWEFILPGLAYLILGIYKGFVYTRVYLLKIELMDNTILKLTTVKRNGEIDEITLNLQNNVKIELSFSLLDFNFLFEVLKMNFNENGKTIYCQYPVSDWDNKNMKNVRKILKEIGIKVNN